MPNLSKVEECRAREVKIGNNVDWHVSRFSTK